MDPAFSESFVNSEHTVLGKRLHPFCLEDIFFLSVADSPFLAGDGPDVKYDWADLALAVEICTKRAPELGKVPRPSRETVLTYLLGFDLAAECQKFVTYTEDFFQRPEMWMEGDGGELGANWILSHIVMVMRHLHLKEREAWEMPVGKVLWYNAATTEQISTGAQIVSEDEAAGMRELGIA